MKNKVIIVLLLITNMVTGYMLYRMWWSRMLWRNEAEDAKFTASLWAANDFAKGKRVKLKLVIRDDPKGNESRPTEFDGPYVVREWIGYTDPMSGGTNSPSIRVARTMVETYNQKMIKMWEDPEKYREQMQKEMLCWQTNVLGKTEVSNRLAGTAP